MADSQIVSRNIPDHPEEDASIIRRREASRAYRARQRCIARGEDPWPPVKRIRCATEEEAHERRKEYIKLYMRAYRSKDQRLDRVCN